MGLFHLVNMKLQVSPAKARYFIEPLACTLVSCQRSWPKHWSIWLPWTEFCYDLSSIHQRIGSHGRAAPSLMTFELGAACVVAVDGGAASMSYLPKSMNAFSKLRIMSRASMMGSTAKSSSPLAAGFCCASSTTQLHLASK